MEAYHLSLQIGTQPLSQRVLKSCVAPDQLIQHQKMENLAQALAEADDAFIFNSDFFFF